MFMQVKDAAQLMRDIDSNDMLGYVGLQRKRSAFTSYVLPGIGFFAAGLAAGAGLGLLLAPSSGRELRGQLGYKFNQVKDKVSNTTQQLREQIAGASSDISGTVQSGIEEVSNEVGSTGQGRYM
jgi:gas vesicle protein